MKSNKLMAFRRASRLLTVQENGTSPTLERFFATRLLIKLFRAAAFRRRSSSVSSEILMNQISDENRMLDHPVAQAFGGKPQVSAYWDEDHNTALTSLVVPIAMPPRLPRSLLDLIQQSRAPNSSDRRLALGVRQVPTSDALGGFCHVFEHVDARQIPFVAERFCI
jgi:hypothetical protein